MRNLLSLLLLSCFIFANQFDMFDTIDEQINLKEEFKVKDKFIDALVKVNYQYNDESENTKFLYLNLNKNESDYFFDIRFFATEDKYSINLKELYYKGKIEQRNIFEIGRINIKDGLARGYNPTDYFKKNISFTNSKDTKEIKDNRLGSIMIKDTIFFDTFTIKSIFSPKISVDNNSSFSNKEHYGMNFDTTNYTNRYSLIFDYSSFNDISSSIIFHHNENDFNIGLNFSYIYNKWILYNESSYTNIKKDIYETTTGFKHTSDINIVTTLEYIVEKNEYIFLHLNYMDMLTNLDGNIILKKNLDNHSRFTQIGLEYSYYDNIQYDCYIKNYYNNKIVKNRNELLLQMKYFF